MRPWKTVDQEDVPDDDSTMYLMSRGSEFAIVANDRELMSNRMHGSEDALADLACDRLAQLDGATASFRIGVRKRAKSTPGPGDPR